jgi:RNA polymerase sigma-70 factor (ECF subfamily)
MDLRSSFHEGTARSRYQSRTSPARLSPALLVVHRANKTSSETRETEGDAHLAPALGDTDAASSADTGGDDGLLDGPRALPESPEDKARLRAMVDQHFDAVWRMLRRLGVATKDMDDCAQQVFWVASRKLSSITAGSEQNFLVSTAVRIAADSRRARGRRREIPTDDAMLRVDPGPQPDELAHQKRMRALLDEVLAAMPMDLRSVFVLFELEELSTPEIAKVLEIPVGTAASRLRRAREEFDRSVVRLNLRGGKR